MLSKFIPKSTTEITQYILFAMDVNCSEKSFRDIAVSTTKFNAFENENSAWKDLHGDRLLLGVIDQFVLLSINSYKCKLVFIHYGLLRLVIKKLRV